MARVLSAVLSVLFLLAASAPAHAQGQGYSRVYVEVDARGDTIPVVDMLPVYVFKRRIDLRRYERLIYNLKRVYPIAKEAKRLLDQTEQKMNAMTSKRDRGRYIKEMEQELKRTYTPVLKKMTYSQGKLLIKLIDRETDRTTYDLVKDLRGSFSAFFWQGVARLFTANLKDTYDGQGDDALIEQLILYYEAGLL